MNNDANATTTVRRVLAGGVWGVVATPFQGSTLDIDADSLVRIVARYESIGATGLTVLGVFGEAAALTGPERDLVLEIVADSCALPFVVGITARATRPAIEEINAARTALGDRLAAVMVQVNSANPATVIDHLHAIHRVTGTDVVLQDYPVASGVAIGTADLVQIVNGCPFIVAIKAEAPPTATAIAELITSVDVAVFGGLGAQGLLDELRAGAAGAMTGFSYPEALIDCVRAWRSTGGTAARAALAPYLPLVNFEQQPRIALAVRKECLKARGLISDAAVRAPATPFPESLRGMLVDHVETADGIVAHSVSGGSAVRGVQSVAVN